MELRIFVASLLIFAISANALNYHALDNDGDGERPPPIQSERISVCPSHPDVDAVAARNAPPYSFPTTHPTIHPQLAPYMPGDHPNLDSLLRRGHRIPSDHPTISPYMYVVPPNEPCMEFGDYVNATGCPATTSVMHPSVDDSIAAGEATPVNHPLVDSLLRPFMPASHRNIDELMAAGTPLPFGHPAIDPYLCRNGSNYTYATGCPVNASYIHPSIDDSIAAGEQLPFGHPLVDPLLRSWMPENHRNIDDLIADGTPLPPGHPVMDGYMCLGEAPASGCVEAFNGHPAVHSSLSEGEQLPGGHPLIDPLLRKFLPDGHGDCDAYIAARTPIPDWHPNIDNYLCERSVFSAGLILGICMGSAFVAAVLFRYIGKYCNPESTIPPERVKRTHPHRAEYKRVKKLPETSMEEKDPKSTTVDTENPKTKVVALTKYKEVCTTLGDDGDGVPEQGGNCEVDISQDPMIRMESFTSGKDEEEKYNEDGTVAPSGFVKPANDADADVEPAPLPRRNLQIHEMEMLHARHKTEDLYEYGGYIDIPTPRSGRVEVPHRCQKEVGVRLIAKSSSLWGRVMIVVNDTRIPYFDWNLGQVLMVIGYLFVNVVCLFLATEPNAGRSWGSLAACNSMLLIIPAARNSILTAGLGIAFDHAVLYHRFIGRFAVLCSLIHGYYYLNYYYRSNYTFITGVGALGCGLIISVTSLNYVRRQLFNLFYWAHYSFVGYLVLAYLHAQQARPFILVGGGLYVADKLLRWVWMSWPRECVEFRTKGDSIVQVRFQKNSVTKTLGMHRVGQYYFVNFPAISLTEWHPFSVSSGPREDTVEMHIRGLGDHTNRIVALAKEREESGVPTTVCIDGPYGLQDFNYRTYPMILLAAGGIGVTPIMGMLKDIYDIDLPVGSITEEPHAIDTIYFLWVMPHLEDYESFRHELESCMEQAKLPSYPKLVPMIYITRSKEKLKYPFVAGRPKLGNIFQGMMLSHSVDDAGLIFACGPQPLVAELWDKSVQHTVKGHHIDFHHEVFDF